MKPGDAAETSRVISAKDVIEYAALTGQNAVDDRIPGPLIGALFSYLLGVRLPGRGTMYLKQETRFHLIAHVGDMLTARVEITRIRPEKHLVNLSTTCTDGGGRLIASGQALVSARGVNAGLESND